MEVDPRWYEAFFADDWLLLAQVNEEKQGRTDQEVEFIVERLALESGARILDVACGHGRHSLGLARRGYRVIGVDSSETSLALARERAGEAGVEVEYVHGDMRALPWESEFDGAINVFTAFGYFPEQAEDEQAAAAIAKALRPGGRFFIDTINPYALAGPSFRPQGWEQLPDGRLLLEDRVFDPVQGRSLATWTLVASDGTTSELKHSLRAYTCAELVALFDRAGLVTETVHGSWDGGEFTGTSWRLMLTAERV
jgi:SAM-dependent methyltransferase